ncbi:MAG: FkbM family methyltransferase [Vicinamibacterales bacterium]
MLRIALFGTGASGERALAAIDQIPGLSVVAVADNAPSKRGSHWQGHQVSSAEELVAGDGWDYICIASQWHTDIAEQLVGLGVPARRLAILDPWGGRGLIVGVERLHELFPTQQAEAGAIPGFEDDFDRLKLLKRLGFDPRVVLDVGASSGPWSVTCARVFPDAQYYLIEPLPHYDGRLLTEKAAGWYHVPVAVGSEDGEATMAIPESQWGAFAATLLPSASGSESEAESLRVPLRRIDTLLAEATLAPPQLVKLDVQGYESAVLAGGERLWESAEAFFVELSLDRYWTGSIALHEMIALFAQRGFFPFDFHHQFRNDDGVLVQIDCVFLRGDGALARSGNLWQRLAA